MEHLLLKAATTATDQGTFTAVISSASIDREGDIVEPSAIVNALAKWAALGKRVPLAYSHVDPTTGQSVVVGHIDPATARIDGKEVVTEGWVDQSTERGAETWRLVKSGTLGFSYGYLVPDGGATKRAGGKGGYHITEIDLFEISVVPVAPANNDTRVLSFKSLTEEDFEALGTDDKVAVYCAALDDCARLPQESLSQDVKDRLATKAQQILDNTKPVAEADETDKEPDKARSVDPLRKQAESVALEFASGGLSLQRPPRKVEQPKREPELPLADLKRRMRDEILIHLSGDTI